MSKNEPKSKGEMVDIPHDGPFTRAPWSGYGHITGRDDNRPPPTEAAADDRSL